MHTQMCVSSCSYMIEKSGDAGLMPIMSVMKRLKYDTVGDMASVEKTGMPELCKRCEEQGI